MRRTQTSLLLLILGAVLVIGGIIYGSRSHYLGYKISGPDKLIHTVVDPNSDTSSSNSNVIFYVQLKGDSNIYYMNTADFVNWEALQDLEPTSYQVSYDDTTAAPINITGKDTSNEGEDYTISGTAYHLVQLVANSGSQSTAINTRQYIQNPQGRYENDWPLGTGGIVLGALLFIVGLYLRRGSQVTPAYMVMQPGQFPPYPSAPTPYAPQTPSPYQMYPPAAPSHPSYPGYPPVVATPSHPSYPDYLPTGSAPSYPEYMPTESSSLAQPSNPSAQPAPSEQYGVGQYSPQPSNPSSPPVQPDASYPFVQSAPSEQYGSGQYSPQEPPISPEAGTAYGSYQVLSNADPEATQIGKPKEE